MKRAALLLALLLAVATACRGDSKPPPAATLPAAAASPAAPVASRVTATATELPLLEAEHPHADRVGLARRLRGVTAPSTSGESRQIANGDRHDFWVVQTEPPRAFQVSATLRTTSAHAYFYVQDDAGVSDSDIRNAAQDFESKVYPTVTGLFGEPVPSPIDPDPRITILHLRLPNVGGYFTNLDQLPAEVVPISNERRMIYIDLRAGPPGTDAYAPLVAHEFQHLIHQGVSPYADTWLNEGLSEVANEAAGGGASAIKFQRDAPNTQLNDWAPSGSNAAHYGTAHSFLRYLLRHYGGLDHVKDLVAQRLDGINSVQRYLQAGGFGVGFEDVFADWLVANYLSLPGDGRFSNSGVETKVRTVTRPSEPVDGAAAATQFGADYYEIEQRDVEQVFRFRGAATVKQVPNDPASGRGEWWSDRGDSMDTTLTRDLDLRSVSSATLRFKAWYDIEKAYDYAYVMVSADGGGSWQVLHGSQASDLDPLGQAFGPGYTGRSGGGEAPAWVDEQIDLTPFAGRSVLLRFEYITDEAAAGPGMAIDDISVPEIGVFDDAETDNGWQASGFRRVTAPLAQRYLIQLVTQDKGGWTAQRVVVAPDGSADIRIAAGSGHVAVIVAGATYGTNLRAPYRWQLGR